MRESSSILPQGKQASLWQESVGPRDRREYWRPCPVGAGTVSTWQPHGDSWRMYWGISPIVRSQGDLGSFKTQWEAMAALDALVADDMRGVLLD
jgi:hypothetical protein